MLTECAFAFAIDSVALATSFTKVMYSRGVIASSPVADSFAKTAGAANMSWFKIFVRATPAPSAFRRAPSIARCSRDAGSIGTAGAGSGCAEGVTGGNSSAGHPVRKARVTVSRLRPSFFAVARQL